MLMCFAISRTYVPFFPPFSLSPSILLPSFSQSLFLVAAAIPDTETMYRLLEGGQPCMAPIEVIALGSNVTRKS